MLFIPLAAQRRSDPVEIPFSQAPYRVGERLTYNVSFSSFQNAAHVELLVAGRGTFFNREGLQLRAHVETTEIINAALYSINNDYTTYVDPASGQPFRTQQVIREGGRTSDTSTEYNAPVGTAAIPARLRTGEFPGTYDLLSALYRLRALPLTEGSLYRLTVRSDQTEHQVELKVQGREMIKTNVGSFNTIATRVRVSNNSAANNYNIRIYFSDDERHVPVLITARHSAGMIRAELASSELRTITAPSGVAAIPPPQPARDPVERDPAGNALLPGLPFSAGEQLNFNVFLGNSQQPVGTASFQVRPRAKYFNRDGLLLTAKAQTVNAAQRIFYANDQINSYVDPVTLLPFRTEMVLHEGQRRVNQTFTIDQDRGNAVSDKGTRLEIPVGTHDIISVLYAMRSFNLAPPRRNAVSLLVGRRPRTLFITSLRRETIELGGQKIPAVQLSLTTDDPQSDKYQFRGWISDDGRRLPLRLTANSPLGPVRADLAIIPLTRQ